jgi:hypothetical protein
MFSYSLSRLLGRKTSKAPSKGLSSTNKEYEPADDFDLESALLVLNAKEGVLKTGGSAAEHLDSVAIWQSQAIGTKNFLSLPGVSSSYAWVPHNDNLDTFGNFSLEVTDVRMRDWTPSATTSILSKWYASYNYRSWSLSIHTDGKVRLDVSFNGSAVTTYYSTVATGLAAEATASFRAIRDSSTITFQMDTGSGFAALGGPVSGVSTTLFNAMYANVEIGSNDGGTANLLTGNIGGVKVFNTATPDSSTPILSIDFSLAARTNRSFAATSGQTVSLQGDGTSIQQATTTDAIQTTSSKRGKYLTPSANNLPAAHFPGVGSNFYSIPDAANLDGWGDFTIEVKGVTLTDWTPSDHMGLISKWTSTGSQRAWRLDIATTGKPTLYISYNGSTTTTHTCTAATGLAADATADIMVMRDGSEVRFYKNGTLLGSALTGKATTALDSGTSVVRVGMGYNTTGKPLTGKMTRARAWNVAVAAPGNPTESPVLDVNFEVNATHGAASFTATTGQTVTTTTSGNNPCRIIGSPVIRFDGSDDTMIGRFMPKLTPGRYFIVATRLGDGGEGSHRIFNTWVAGLIETGVGGFIHEYSAGSYYASDGAFFTNHLSIGTRYMRQLKCSASAQSVLINGANALSETNDMSAMSSTDYALTGNYTGGENAAIDIEFLALYPESMTNAEAHWVKSKINEVFSVY